MCADSIGLHSSIMIWYIHDLSKSVQETGCFCHLAANKDNCFCAGRVSALSATFVQNVLIFNFMAFEEHRFVRKWEFLFSARSALHTVRAERSKQSWTLNSPKDFASACASVTNFGCVPWLEILQIRPQVRRPHTPVHDRWDHYFRNIYNTYL